MGRYVSVYVIIADTAELLQDRLLTAILQKTWPLIPLHDVYCYHGIDAIAEVSISKSPESTAFIFLSHKALVRALSVPNARLAQGVGSDQELLLAPLEAMGYGRDGKGDHSGGHTHRKDWKKDHQHRHDHHHRHVHQQGPASAGQRPPLPKSSNPTARGSGACPLDGAHQAPGADAPVTARTPPPGALEGAVKRILEDMGKASDGERHRMRCIVQGLSDAAGNLVGEPKDRQGEESFNGCLQASEAFQQLRAQVQGVAVQVWAVEERVEKCETAILDRIDLLREFFSSPQAQGRGIPTGPSS